MGDARKPAALDEHDKKLDPQHFAHISDNTYTAEEVEAHTQVSDCDACSGQAGQDRRGGSVCAPAAPTCSTATPAFVCLPRTLQVIVGLIPDRLKRAPNAKMFLRSFWYRATLTEVVLADEMHIYTLARWGAGWPAQGKGQWGCCSRRQGWAPASHAAGGFPPQFPGFPSCPSCSFLLQLALLDMGCSEHVPSLMAAAALSVALGVYGRPAWPREMQQFGSYLERDLAPVKARLAELQATQAAEQLRPLWRGMYEEHSCPEYEAEWRHAVLAFSCASRLAPMPTQPPRTQPVKGAASALSAAGVEASDLPAPPQPTDASAMLTD